MDGAIAGEDLRRVAQIVQRDREYRETERAVNRLRPRRIGQIRGDIGEPSSMGREPPPRIGQHRMRIILQCHARVRKARQHLLRDGAIARPDIEDLDRGVAREGRQFQHFPEVRPPFRVARDIVRDPIRDILLRVPVVMHRWPAPRCIRHPRPLFCDSALHFNPTNRRERRGRLMRRRELLKTGLAAAVSFAAPLAAPRPARAAKASTLIFVPTSDLAVLDPIVTFNRPTRNYAYLVFDTLYGLDTNWQAQPQMVLGHEADDDGLTWNLRLRDGLRFHDKEPVLAGHVVASIRRFVPRVSFATALMAATEELSAPDDRTVKFRLKRPFPHLPAALAGPGGTVPAIMPERLAATSPYQPVKEIVGSGPYRYLLDEHVSGARSAFARFEQYRPRDGGGPAGAPGFTSGPKVTHFD